MKNLLFILVLLIGSLTMTSSNNFQSSFCEGWEDGYQEALDGCMRVGVTPLCPIAPVGKDTYKHGFGMGYAKGERYCNDW